MFVDVATQKKVLSFLQGWPSALFLPPPPPLLPKKKEKVSACPFPPCLSLSLPPFPSRPSPCVLPSHAHTFFLLLDLLPLPSGLEPCQGTKVVGRRGRERGGGEREREPVLYSREDAYEKEKTRAALSRFMNYVLEERKTLICSAIYIYLIIKSVNSFQANLNNWGGCGCYLDNAAPPHPFHAKPPTDNATSLHQWRKKITGTLTRASLSPHLNCSMLAAAVESASL